MIVFKTNKFKLYPDGNQINLIHTRFVYNYFLSKKDIYYKETKK